MVGNFWRTKIDYWGRRVVSAAVVGVVVAPPVSAVLWPVNRRGISADFHSRSAGRMEFLHYKKFGYYFLPPIVQKS